MWTITGIMENKVNINNLNLFLQLQGLVSLFFGGGGESYYGGLMALVKRTMDVAKDIMVWWRGLMW